MNLSKSDLKNIIKLYDSFNISELISIINNVDILKDIKMKNSLIKLKKLEKYPLNKMDYYYNYYDLLVGGKSRSTRSSRSRSSRSRSSRSSKRKSKSSKSKSKSSKSKSKSSKSKMEHLNDNIGMIQDFVPGQDNNLEDESIPSHHKSHNKHHSYGNNHDSCNKCNNVHQPQQQCIYPPQYNNAIRSPCNNPNQQQYVYQSPTQCPNNNSPPLVVPIFLPPLPALQKGGKKKFLSNINGGYYNESITNYIQKYMQHYQSLVEQNNKIQKENISKNNISEKKFNLPNNLNISFNINDINNDDKIDDKVNTIVNDIDNHVSNKINNEEILDLQENIKEEIKFNLLRELREEIKKKISIYLNSKIAEKEKDSVQIHERPIYQDTVPPFYRPGIVLP